MAAVCAVARSAAGTATRSWPALTKTVVRGEPFHCTTDPGMKLDPTRVSQVFPAGAVTLPGDAIVTEGTGFGLDERGSTADPCSKTT
jgi:hypothetical protein